MLRHRPGPKATRVITRANLRKLGFAGFVVVVIGVTLLSPTGITRRHLRRIDSSSLSSSCSSGVLQPVYHPSTDDSGDAYGRGRSPGAVGDCTTGLLGFSPSMELCTGAHRVVVDTAGVLRLSALPPVPFTTASASTLKDLFPCQALNVSGLLSGGSNGTAANVTVWGVMAGELLATLTKTGPERITLTVPRALGGGADAGPCQYRFKVVGGCFFGIRAPSAPLACPANHFVARAGSSRHGAEFCAACPHGTTSPGLRSKNCNGCPKAEYGPVFAGGCRKCPSGAYSHARGASECKRCIDEQGTRDRTGWTDGKTCSFCPDGSTGSRTNPLQCHTCTGSTRCCIVNPSDDCPACPPGWSPAPSSTSTFALTSASTPACLVSRYALCAPQFRLSVDSTTCFVTLSSMATHPSTPGCEYTDQTYISGGGENSTIDFTRGSATSSEASLLHGWISGVSGPYLDFTLPSPNCTLRYRALTTSADAILGVAPEPCHEGTPGCPFTRFASTTPVCPAGSYLEPETDAKPQPCLPCPPGTYSPAPSREPCAPCPPGTSAVGYGSKECAKCTLQGPHMSGFLSAPGWRGSGEVCLKCNPEQCTSCPQFSGVYSPQPPAQRPPADPVACLSNQLGAICCVLGDCEGQAPCPPTLQESSEDDFTAPGAVIGAVLQLVSRQLTQPQCRYAPLLRCLADEAVVLMTFRNLEFSLIPTLQPGCLSNGDQVALEGGFTSTSSGTGTHTHSSALANGAAIIHSRYHLRSDATGRHVTIVLSSSYEETPETLTAHAKNITDHSPTDCTATFKLTAGRAFDLAAPDGPATCPAHAEPVVIKGGPTFCRFCAPGNYMANTTHTCDRCPAGTYTGTIGANACTPCPAGTYCPKVESKEALPCKAGYHSAEPGSTQCSACPANTFAAPASTACTSCPALSQSAVGSGACRMSFP